MYKSSNKPECNQMHFRASASLNTNRAIIVLCMCIEMLVPYAFWSVARLSSVLHVYLRDSLFNLWYFGLLFDCVTSARTNLGICSVFYIVTFACSVRVLDTHVTVVCSFSVLQFGFVVLFFIDDK